MLKADPVETLARRNCESILARYAAESTALSLSPSTAALSGRSQYPPLTGRFNCKICGKAFATFQALGGHTSSHAKHSFPEPARRSPIADERENAVPVRRSKVHECSKCGARFTTGQALGGHMRKHFDLSAKRKRAEYDGEIEEKKIETVPFRTANSLEKEDGEITDEEEVEEKVKTVPFPRAPPEDKTQVFLFDLNFPPVADDSRNKMDLQLSLGS